MQRVIDPLTAMGARVASRDGRAPLEIEGGDLIGISWTTPVPSAQIKSAILLAGIHATGRTTVTEALPTRDHTERAFRAFGIVTSTDGPSGDEAALIYACRRIAGSDLGAGLFATPAQ